MIAKNLPLVRFLDTDCYLKVESYAANDRPCLRLFDCENYEPMATATVNIMEETPAPNCVFIKTWSENEGILEALEKAGVVKRTGRQILCGFGSVAEEAQLIS